MRRARPCARRLDGSEHAWQSATAFWPPPLLHTQGAAAGAAAPVVVPPPAWARWDSPPAAHAPLDGAPPLVFTVATGAAPGAGAALGLHPYSMMAPPLLPDATARAHASAQMAAAVAAHEAAQAVKQAAGGSAGSPPLAQLMHHGGSAGGGDAAAALLPLADFFSSGGGLGGFMDDMQLGNGGAR